MQAHTNDNLEAMAKQLYDYWFVQFDFPDENGSPYKSSGGRLVLDDLSGKVIPQNWGVSKLDEIGSFRNGINYTKSEIGNRTYRIVNVRNISASTIMIDTDDLDEISLKSSLADRFLIKHSDILIARSGVPGATRIMAESNGDHIFCGFIICLSPRNDDDKAILTYQLKELEIVTKSQSGGSILSNVSQDVLKRLYVIRPPHSILRSFNDCILPIWKMISNNIKETSDLVKQRDKLLSMLLTGQARLY